MKYIVYITINLCNGKFYIGYHKTNPDIFDGYIGNGVYSNIKEGKADTPFKKAVKKYGYKNFRRTTLVVVDTLKEARAIEALLVNPTLLKSKNCYNMIVGGSSETCPQLRKTVYQYALDGNFIRSYKGLKEAAREFAPNNYKSMAVSIRQCCQGKTCSAGGYWWSFTKKFNPKENECLRKVAKYTLSGKFLTYYESMAEASKTTSGDIHQALTDPRYTAGGFRWRYYTGDTSDLKIDNFELVRVDCLPIVVSKKEEFIAEFSSMEECAKKMNLQINQIKRCLRGKIKTHFGYSFKFKDEDIVCG